jgi:hypothetical protein
VMTADSAAAEKALKELSLGALPHVPGLSAAQRRSRDGSGSATNSSRRGSSAAIPKLVTPTKVDMEAIKRTCRDGRTCILCPAKDNVTMDVLLADEHIMWGYAPRNYKKPQDSVDKWVPEGKCDFYCIKVYKNVYKVRYKTIELLKAAFGTDPALLKEFQASYNVTYVARAMLVFIRVWFP